MPLIPDINDSELWIADTTLQERYDEKRYRTHFKQFSTGTDKYDDLAQCVVSVLQCQADHDRKLKDLAVA